MIETALELQKECEQICREMGTEEGVLRSLNNQALLRMDMDQLDRAAELLAEMERLCDQIGADLELATCKLNQAMVHARGGRFEEALECVETGESISLEQGDIDTAGRCLLYQSIFLSSFLGQPARAAEVGSIVREAMGDRPYAVLASTDFTHNDFMHTATREDREWLRERDQMAIDRILALDAGGLHDVVTDNGITMCGMPPVMAMMETVQGKSAELLKYACSAQVAPSSYVVGYAAIRVE